MHSPVYFQIKEKYSRAREEYSQISPSYYLYVVSWSLVWTALPSAQAQALPTHQMWQRYHAATQEAQWHRVVRASCDALHLYQGGHGPINACNAGTTRRCSASATCIRPCCCHLMTTPFFCWMSNSWSWSTIRNISAGDNAKLLLTMPPPPPWMLCCLYSHRGGWQAFFEKDFSSDPMHTPTLWTGIGTLTIGTSWWSSQKLCGGRSHWDG